MKLDTLTLAERQERNRLERVLVGLDQDVRWAAHCKRRAVRLGREIDEAQHLLDQARANHERTLAEFDAIGRGGYEPDGRGDR